MAIKFDPRALTAEQRLAMTATLQKDTTKRERSPLTDLGKEEGIEIFSLKGDDMVNNKMLVYIPRMPVVVDDSGKPQPWAVPISSVRLSKLNNVDEKTNYAGSFVNTAGRQGFEDFGVSGNPEILFEYSSRSYLFKSAIDMLELAKQYGYSELQELVDNGDVKEIKDFTNQHWGYSPVKLDSNPTYYLPIVVVETEKDSKTGKNQIKPQKYPIVDAKGKEVPELKVNVVEKRADGSDITDADGNPVTREVVYKDTYNGTVKWIRLSKKAFDDKYTKALASLGDSEDAPRSGVFMTFDYTIDEEALKKAHQASGRGGGAKFQSEEMKSGASLSINLVPNSGKPSALYEKADALGLMAEWDTVANEKYNELMLLMTVKACEYPTDEEVAELLQKEYGTLEEFDAKIEMVKAQTAEILASVKAQEAGVEATKSVLERRVGAGRTIPNPPPALGNTGAGEATDLDEDDLPFGVE